MKDKDEPIGVALRDIKAGESIWITLSGGFAFSEAIEFNDHGHQVMHEKFHEALEKAFDSDDPESLPRLLGFIE